MLDLSLSESMTERLMKFTNTLIKYKRFRNEDKGTYLECQGVEHIRYTLDRESYAASVFCFHSWLGHKIVAMYGGVEDFAKCSDPNMYEVSYDPQQCVLDIHLRSIGDQVLHSV